MGNLLFLAILKIRFRHIDFAKKIVYYILYKIHPFPFHNSGEKS